MPTTHVEPGCDPLLQDIANALWKARKVVVITGAGISTNSGIPDFRSENGLYSLIQAQFDAARHEGPNGNSDVDTDTPFDDRPTKRRRVSRDASGTDGQVTLAVERPFPGLCKGAAKDGKAAEGEHADRIGKEESHPSSDPSPASTLPQLRPETLDRRRTAPTAEQESVPSFSDSTPVQSVTPIQSPRMSHRQMDADEAHPQRPAMEPPPPFPSSPPSVTLGTPRPLSRPQLLHSIPGSSSPLSSPPPVTFDPYEESTCSPSSQDSESSRSESEDPSAALSSQTSVGSSRSSLPMMKGRDLFDAQIWSCPIKTSVFYTFVSTLRQKVRTAEPTSSHRFLSVLRDSRKLVRCYTQNIDQLEERVGLSTTLSLGAGSRYRFSTRAGRVSGGLKSSAKAAEGAAGDAEGVSGKAVGRQADPRPRGSEQDGRDLDLADPKDGPPQAAQLSRSASDLSSTSNDPSTSTQAASTPPSAPTAPNRGVECVFLHGSLAELRCFVCARTAAWDDEARLADTLAGRQPTCPHCAGATAAREERGKRALGVGKLRPDIVLYGEEHPHAHLISPLVQHDLSLGPDMLLILGTSMRVHGLKVLVREFAKAVHDRGGKVVFVNFTKPPESVWADIIDYWVQWDCDAWVGDLQQRKPALWLPPGAAPPDEGKQKVAKLSRKQSSAESRNQKEGSTEDTSKKGRESDTLGGGQEKNDGMAYVHAPTPDEPKSPQQRSSQETSPSTLCRFPEPMRGRQGRAARIPKLNPKRPACVRDHKLNGAYLVWKIMKDLGRITDRPLYPVVIPSRSTNRSLGSATMTSAPTRRKEAPKHSLATTRSTSHLVVTGKTPLTTAALPCQDTKPSNDHDGSSISATVKTRKRKRAEWRMIKGVETLVPVDDGAPSSASTPSRQTSSTRILDNANRLCVAPTLARQGEVVLMHPKMVQSADFKSSTNLRSIYDSPAESATKVTTTTTSTLGVSDQMTSCAWPTMTHRPPFSPTRPAPRPAAATDLDAGFRDTDRLIAAAREPLSRSSTPGAARLAPLITLSADDVPHVSVPPRRPPLLEPKLTSSLRGPRAEISSSNIVGSPAVVERHCDLGANTGQQQQQNNNPFFFYDPLAAWLEFPPVWPSSHDGHAVAVAVGGQGHHGLEQQGLQGVLRRLDHGQVQNRGYGVVGLGQRSGFGEGGAGGGASEGREVFFLAHHDEGRVQRQHYQQQHYSQQQQQAEQQRRQQQRKGEQAGLKRDGRVVSMSGPSSSSSWSPDEQLRKEHEAALMLSSLRGG
ncbi:uncharacterized protein B0T15DRAFT_138083 [Chaetomium strumarium]|uniref:Deacetylase sirtuin-type domain-containing protein n=1 Tax=Chaetomium strumarium TaxID=1170767 RepID=A0AAJ0GUZ6_9PEZI|nr:hypothetical protein B0T15DRAFT_138083 [Chaetomium strumarium]